MKLNRVSLIIGALIVAVIQFGLYEAALNNPVRLGEMSYIFGLLSLLPLGLFFGPQRRALFDLFPSPDTVSPPTHSWELYLVLFLNGLIIASIVLFIQRKHDR